MSNKDKDNEAAVAGTESESRALQQLPEATEIATTMEAINEFQKLVKHHLVPGADYSKEGLFGKGSKPSLLKAGAEKIMTLVGCRPQYDILTEIEDFDIPRFYYKVRCQMVHMKTGQIWGDGIGSCNSDEKRYTWNAYAKKKRPFEFSDVNTIQKMAQKRAMVQAVLTLGRLSNLFIQDIEDYQDHPNSTESQRQTQRQAKPKETQPDPDTLQLTERKILKDWAEEYPWIKEQLAGKTFGEITRDEYLEIADKIKVIQQEFNKEDATDGEIIDEDVPF